MQSCIFICHIYIRITLGSDQLPLLTSDDIHDDEDDDDDEDDEQDDEDNNDIDADEFEIEDSNTKSAETLLSSTNGVQPLSLEVDHGPELVVVHSFKTKNEAGDNSILEAEGITCPNNQETKAITSNFNKDIKHDPKIEHELDVLLSNPVKISSRCGDAESMQDVTNLVRPISLHSFSSPNSQHFRVNDVSSKTDNSDCYGENLLHEKYLTTNDNTETVSPSVGDQWRSEIFWNSTRHSPWRMAVSVDEDQANCTQNHASPVFLS